MIRAYVLAAAGLVLASGTAVARAEDKPAQQAKDDMTVKYEAKVAESWFTTNGFTDDFDTAKKRAKETGKPIFAYFTRSYAP